MRVKAARLGANALLNVACEDKAGTSLVKNCWSSLTCHAAAIKIRVTRSGPEIQEKLRVIQELKERGLITSEEADQRRKDLLDRLLK